MEGWEKKVAGIQAFLCHLLATFFSPRAMSQSPKDLGECREGVCIRLEADSIG